MNPLACLARLVTSVIAAKHSFTCALMAWLPRLRLGPGIWTSGPDARAKSPGVWLVGPWEGTTEVEWRGFSGFRGGGWASGSEGTGWPTRHSHKRNMWKKRLGKAEGDAGSGLLPVFLGDGREAHGLVPQGVAGLPGGR